MSYAKYAGIGGGGGGGGNHFSSIVLDGATSGALTLTVPAVVSSYTLVFPAAQGGAGQTLVNDGSGGLTWEDAAAITVGTFDGQTPSADGLSLIGDVLYAQAATDTVPGMVSVGTQTWSGDKTLEGQFTSDNITGINSGDVTIGAGNGLTLSGQQISLALSSTSTTGALSSADWNTFNGKQAALTIGNISDAGTDGIVVTGGTGAIIGSGVTLAQHVADASHNGYLSSTDWSTFNGKQVSGNYITALTGDVTASGPGSVAASLVATTNGTLTTLSALTTASSLATVGTITVGVWSGTTVAINHGGTGVTSVTTAPTASAWSGWDANLNHSANNSLLGYATTATAAGTTTLTVASAYQQYFTGSTTQTVQLPVVSTLVLGQSFQIVNLSTGTVTVNSSGGNLVQSILAGSSGTVTCVSTSGTGAASWSAIVGPSASGAAVAPTVQKFTSSSGTYTTPTNPAPLYIRVRMVGAGGGGSGSGTAAGTGQTAGGNTTFGTTLLAANGGGAGRSDNSNLGVGGTASLGTGPIGTALTGGDGGQGAAATGTNFVVSGATGGSSALGGGGCGGWTGVGNSGATNTGSGGGGGGGTNAGNMKGGSGGGAGGYVDAIINSPSSTYSYAVGAGGTAGSAGTSGAAGGAGGSGYIEVTEYYVGNSTGGIPVANQTANTFYSGPVSGGAATPGFRALVNLDVAPISSLDKSTGVAIHGTNTNNSPSAGYVGEVIESVVGTATSLPASSTNFGNLTSISLTAGDWMVTALAEFASNGATITFIRAAIDTTTSGAGVRGDTQINGVAPTAAADSTLTIPPKRFSLSTTTTIFLTGAANFTVATPQYYCRITAVRIR